MTTEVAPTQLSVIRDFREGDDEPVIYATTARVLSFDTNRAAGAPTRESLLAKAKARAVDPDFLDENPPYFWMAEISSGRIDSYSTIMQDSTLKNFARDAEAGVSFQNSHNVRTLPFGASLAGRFHNGRGDKPASTEADFYTVPGLRTNEVTTDDLIRGIKSGIIRDVSVGFHGGQTICSICSRDMDAGFMDWLFGDGDSSNICMHYPGVTYELKDANGKKTGEKALCVGRIENAGLAEVSAVYKGATPNASVQRARMASEAGKLPPEMARRLEESYRISLPASHRVWTPGEGRTAQKQETPVTDQDPRTLSDNPGDLVTPAVRAALKRSGFELTGDDQAAALETALNAQADEVVRLRAREAELTPLADAGKQYRADLVTETLLEGKKAMGLTFKEETYRSLLENAPIEQIKTMRDGFTEAVRAMVAPGARVDATVTEDSGTREGEGAKGAAVPDAAFRSRN